MFISFYDNCCDWIYVPGGHENGGAIHGDIAVSITSATGKILAEGTTWETTFNGRWGEGKMPKPLHPSYSVATFPCEKTWNYSGNWYLSITYLYHMLQILYFRVKWRTNTGWRNFKADPLNLLSSLLVPSFFFGETVWPKNEKRKTRQASAFHRLFTSLKYVVLVQQLQFTHIMFVYRLCFSTKKIRKRRWTILRMSYW